MSRPSRGRSPRSPSSPHWPSPCWWSAATPCRGPPRLRSGSAVFGRALAPRVVEHLLLGRPREPAPVPGLSERESEVLRLMAEGLDNARIARQLGLTVETVQNHVSRLLTKLGARDRVEVVLRFRADR